MSRRIETSYAITTSATNLLVTYASTYTAQTFPAASTSLVSGSGNYVLFFSDDVMTMLDWTKETALGAVSKANFIVLVTALISTLTTTGPITGTTITATTKVVTDLIESRTGDIAIDSTGGGSIFLNNSAIEILSNVLIGVYAIEQCSILSAGRMETDDLTALTANTTMLIKRKGTGDVTITDGSSNVYFKAYTRNSIPTALYIRSEYLSIYATGTTSVADTTIVALVLAGTLYNTHSWSINLATVTIPTAGLYEIHGGITIDSHAGTTILQALLYSNGSQLARHDTNAAASSYACGCVSKTVRFAANDTLALVAYQTSGGTRVTVTGTGATWLTVRKICE